MVARPDSVPFPRGLLPALGIVVLLMPARCWSSDVLCVGDVNEGVRTALQAAIARPGEDGLLGELPAPAASTLRPGMLGEALEEARGYEARFDLTGALYAYRRGCLTAVGAGVENPNWPAWEAACEGAVRAAYGVNDGAALDEVLITLLTHRPGRPFPPEQFPPEVAQRAGELCATLDYGNLRITGAPARVWLDGLPSGSTPLLLTDIPAGRHIVSCGSYDLPLELMAGHSSTVACPLHPDPDSAGELLAQLRGSTITWALLGDQHGLAGMASGVWVFMGGNDPVGIHVGAVPMAEDVASWEVAVSTLRRVPRRAD